MAQAGKDNPAGPVGLVGIGNMGAPMARCLARAGWSVLAHDSRPAAQRSIAGEAGIAAADAAEVAARCRIVIAMLPNGRIVRDAVLGAGGRPGLAANMRRGTIVVDMSSSEPLGTRALGEELARLGIGLVDAPVSGGVPRARTGTLAIMAGGEAALINAVEPVLSAMGKVLRTGPLGSGHAMKALNNYVSAAGLAAACEALIVAGRFGIDAAVATDVLNASTGRNNSTENKLKQHIVGRTFGSGFALDLMVKDLATARDLARGLGVPAPGLEDVSDMYARAAEGLGAGADHTAIFAWLEAMSPPARDAAAE